MSSAYNPHAVILAERSVPSPIWLAAMLGPERILKVMFRDGSHRSTYRRQVLEAILERTASNGGYLPAFGAPRGFVINYAADRAVRFDLAAVAIEILPQPLAVGVAELTVGGRRIPRAILTGRSRSNSEALSANE